MPVCLQGIGLKLTACEPASSFPVLKVEVRYFGFGVQAKRRRVQPTIQRWSP